MSSYASSGSLFEGAYYLYIVLGRGLSQGHFFEDLRYTPAVVSIYIYSGFPIYNPMHVKHPIYHEIFSRVNKTQGLPACMRVQTFQYHRIYFLFCPKQLKKHNMKNDNN